MLLVGKVERVICLENKVLFLSVLSCLDLSYKMIHNFQFWEKQAVCYVKSVVGNRIIIVKSEVKR